jgi:hypothetical protein
MVEGKWSKKDAAGNLTLPAPNFLKQGRSQKIRALSRAVVLNRFSLPVHA